MGIKSSVKKLFGRIFGGWDDYTNTTVGGKAITSDIVNYISALSNFANMDEEDIYEQMLVWDPEIGGAIDRLGTMVGQSVKGFYIKTDKPLTRGEKKVLKLATEMQERLKIESIFESFSEILITHGNLFVDRSFSGSGIILPNKYVSFVSNPAEIQTADVTKIITNAPIMVLYEKATGINWQIVNRYDHIKYKDTPVFMRDCMGRQTYGVYSPSPIHRTILPKWWQRQTMIIDIMLRWKNVPREHHMLDSSMFALSNYTGTKEARIAASKADAQSAITEYVASLKSQQPDQGYVSLDTTKIQNQESKTSYTTPNQLIEQLNSSVYNAMNIPESIVNGRSGGSYASELVVSNYVTAKIMLFAKKVKPTVLGMVQERIMLIDDKLPVEKLDINIELVLETSKMELVRQAAVMATLGLFTGEELRDMLNYEALTEDQKKDVVMIGGRTKTVGDVSRDVGASGENDVKKQPETSHSNEQHHNDAGQQSMPR